MAYFRKADGSINKWAAAMPLVAAALLSFLGTPTGTAATVDDFDGYQALASWYTWPLHGSLRAFQTISPSLGWIGAMVVPGLFIGFLAILPLLARKLGAVVPRAGLAVFLVYFDV